MKYNLLFIFSLLIFNISCEKKLEKEVNTVKYNLLKVEFSPTFHQNGEILIDFSNQTISFYNNSLNTIQEPFLEVGETKKSENHFPKLIPFTSKITNEEKNKIISILNKFSEKEINRKADIGIDGMNSEINIFYHNLDLINISNIHMPTENESQLFNAILTLVLEKTKEENNKTIIRNINKYVH